MTVALLFVSTFILVFALGLQSQFVNNGHYLGAFGNSLVISLCNLGALRVINAGGAIDIAAYILGGPFGIVASMYVYRKHLRRKTNHG